MPENTYDFGLSNCGIAPITVTNGADVYGTIAPVPGAIDFKATPKGDVVPYEADNEDYLVVDKSEGYDCEAKFYGVPETVVKTYFGQTEDSKKVAAEYAGVTFPRFAFLGQIKGDVANRRFTFMNCVMTSRMEIASKTSKSKEPNVVIVKFSAKPRTSDNLVKLMTKSDTDATVYANWFTTVQDFVPAGD